MSWDEGVLAMCAGHSIRRASDQVTTVIDSGRPELQGEHWRDGLEHAPVIDAGCEGCKLMPAWGANDKPALVFIGADSRQPFIPSHEDQVATDWRIEV